jgi:hypothetical protein
MDKHMILGIWLLAKGLSMAPLTREILMMLACTWLFRKLDKNLMNALSFFFPRALEETESRERLRG